MRVTTLLQLLALVLLCTACSSQSSLSPVFQTSLAPLHGTSADSIGVETTGDVLQVTFNSIPVGGSYARLQLPAGVRLLSSEWEYSGEAVSLAVATTDGADLGIVPMARGGPSAAKAVLHIGLAAKSAQKAPTGSQNRVTDLRISEYNGDQALLEWTEASTGDYDFNGEVNIADIAPVAIYFNRRYSPLLDNAEELTVYWVDGDKNHEINAADLTPLAINFGNEVSGYYILRNGVTVKEPDSEEPRLFGREDADFRLQPNPLPPHYSAVVEGSTSDSWSVLPVDSQGNRGTVSAGVITGETIDAKSSVTISGISLWEFEDSKEGGGFSAMWVIDPIDDVDWAHVGKKYVGPNGEAVFDDLPRQTQLFLEISYAPKTNLLTGEPVSREEAIAEPFRTRMPFTLPESVGLVEFSPEIAVSSTENGITIDLFAELPTMEGTKPLRSQLVLPAGLVSYDT
ncbi:MAG TPA: hypothetical protein ENO21_00755, partial [Firmicutes bacterium]|nr:hypothetical protein [Bacillota bacterium]